MATPSIRRRDASPRQEPVATGAQLTALVWAEPATLGGLLRAVVSRARLDARRMPGAALWLDGRLDEPETFSGEDD